MGTAAFRDARERPGPETQRQALGQAVSINPLQTPAPGFYSLASTLNTSGGRLVSSSRNGGGSIQDMLDIAKKQNTPGPGQHEVKVIAKTQHSRFQKLSGGARSFCNGAPEWDPVLLRSSANSPGPAHYHLSHTISNTNRINTFGTSNRFSQTPCHRQLSMNPGPASYVLPSCICPDKGSAVSWGNNLLDSTASRHTNAHALPTPGPGHYHQGVWFVVCISLVLFHESKFGLQSSDTLYIYLIVFLFDLVINKIHAPSSSVCLFLYVLYT